MNNAIKFTSEGYISFKIQCTNLKIIGVLKLSIADTGVGIPQDKIVYFDSFSQNSISSHRVGGWVWVYILSKHW
jgi:signal transduction histidine kinase